MSAFPRRKAQALEVVSRLGRVQNIDMAQALGITRECVVSLMRDLVHDGLLERHEKGEGRRKLEWSLSPSGRQAVAGAPELVAIGERIRSLANKPGAPITIGDGRYAVVRRKPAEPAPVQITGSMAPRGEATGAASAPKAVGIAAGYDARYQCAPGERPYGAGFAAVGIGRDVHTGRGWGM